MAILNDLIVKGPAKFLGSVDANINVVSAERLTTSEGSATQPVYFSGGKPVATTYTLEKSVPSDAVFTDTVTTVTTSGSGNAVTAIAASNGVLTVTKGSTFLTTHPTITKSTDSTSTATPAHGGTFTVVDSVTRDGNGHVTKVNTKTVTLPADNNTDTKVTQTVTTANATFPLLLAPKGQTDTTTTSSYFDSAVTLNPSTNTIAANISGNSATATKLATARTISLTGSITGSGSFDGSGNLSIATKTNHTHNYLPLSGGTLTGDLILARSGGGRVTLNAPSSDTSLAGSTIDSSNGVLRIYGAKSADGTTVTSVGYALGIDPYNMTVGGINKTWSFDGTHTSYAASTTSSFITSVKHSSVNGDVYAEYYRSKTDNITNEYIHRIFTQKFDNDKISSYADLITSISDTAVAWNFKSTNLSSATLFVNNKRVFHEGYKPYEVGSFTYPSKNYYVKTSFKPSIAIWGNGERCFIEDGQANSTYGNGFYANAEGYAPITDITGGTNNIRYNMSGVMCYWIAFR